MISKSWRLAYRSELGPERFPGLLSQANSDIGVAEEIPSLLGQMDAANAHTSDTGTAGQGMITKQTRNCEPPEAATQRLSHGSVEVPRR